MSDTTARDDLRIPLGLAWGLLGRPIVEVDELLDEYDAARRNEVLTEAAEQLLPPWEAVYDSATFTPRLLAYCNDLSAAMGAAKAWLREHCADAVGLVWTPDPQMAVGEWDQWFELTRTDPETGTVLPTEIVVRRRTARTTTAPTTLDA
jgi:hypothetical protein